MLKALLNKGGAGKSISRAETAERLSGLMRSYNELMYTYDAAARVCDASTEASLAALNHGVRDDIGKFSELILSAGVAPPLGTDIEPADVSAGDDQARAVATLIKLESEFATAIQGESKSRHMLRTVALLENTSARIKSRIEALEKLTG